MTTYSPPSNPGHECQEFQAPEGIYHLANQAFFRSLTPNFSIGTTASLVSIKYKETTFNNLQRYEPQPGARSYRRIFGSTSSSTSHDNNSNNNNNNNINSDEESRTPSLSSSSSSYNNNNSNNSNNNNTTSSSSSSNNNNSNKYLHPHQGHHYHQHGGIPVSPLSPSIPEGQAVNNNSTIPKLGSSLEGPSFLSTSPPLPPNMISPSLSTSTTNSNNYIHGNSNNNSNSINNSNGNSSNNGGFSFLSRNNSVSSRRKPRTNITKTTSSFVNKIVTNNQLAKILVARTSEDTNLFYNCGNSFVWIDAFGHPKVNHHFLRN